MITDSYGFRSAERAYENQNPYDDDCICTEDDLEVCNVCGLPAGEGECEDELCEMRPATGTEKADLRPVRGCRQHGWCDGCSSANCEDCGGGY